MNDLIRQEGRALIVAMGLLTRIPMPQAGSLTAATLGHSLHWYPAAGVAIGLILLLGASLLPGSGLLVAVLTVTAWAALTGALHLDGLADSADAWAGGMGDRTRTLAIMKDPACGPMGAVTLLLTLLLKVASLEALLAHPQAGWWWLAPVVARAVLPLAFTAVPYVRAGGMGDGLAAHASRPGIGMATLLTLGLGTTLLPAALGWLWLATAAGLFILWRWAVLRRLGGFTGDCAGALVELLEVALLVCAALFLTASAGLAA